MEVSNSEYLDKGPWIENIPAPSRNKYFQNQLNKKIGMTVEGQPIIRVEWGMEEMEFACGEQRAKYLSATTVVPERFLYTDIETGEQKSAAWDEAPEGITPASAPGAFTYMRYDVGVPRFFLAEHMPRGDYADWEANRYYTDEGTGELIDVLGPRPEHFYVPFMCVAAHEGGCCDGSGVKYSPEPSACYGKFRFPNESDLQKVQRMRQLRDADKQYRMPGDQITKPELEEVGRYALDRNADHWQKAKARMQEQNDAWFRLHGWHLTEFDPTVQSWGKHHFMGGHSKSGLIVPGR